MRIRASAAALAALVLLPLFALGTGLTTGPVPVQIEADSAPSTARRVWIRNDTKEVMRYNDSSDVWIGPMFYERFTVPSGVSSGWFRYQGVTTDTSLAVIRFLATGAPFADSTLVRGFVANFPGPASAVACTLDVYVNGDQTATIGTTLYSDSLGVVKSWPDSSFIVPGGSTVSARWRASANGTCYLKMRCFRMNGT